MIMSNTNPHEVPSIVPQNFYKYSQNVFVSSRIDINQENNIITINGEHSFSRYFDRFQLFKFLKYSRLVEAFTRKELVFLSPNKWMDPYERAFTELVESKNLCDGYKAYCLCTTYAMAYNAEAMWKAYAHDRCPYKCNDDEKILRLDLNFKKLIEILCNITSESNNLLIYITLVDYSLDQAKIQKLYKEKKICTKFAEAEYVQLLSYKRKAFGYENELRVIVLKKQQDKKTNENDDDLLKIGIDLSTIIDKITMEPIVPKYKNNRWEYDLKANDSLRKKVCNIINVQGGKKTVEQSQLYNPKKIK